MTRILIADDHEVVRVGLRSILEAQPGWEIVADVADAEAAIDKAPETKPDVAILGYSIPFMDGIEAAIKIRERDPNVEVLILTMHHSEALVSDVGDVGEAGACAYLLKSDTRQDIVSAIEALAAHRPFFSGQVPEALLIAFRLPQKHQPKATLSSRERVVMQLIAEGHTNRDIGSKLGRNIKTIETQRAAILRKLNITSTAEIVRYAIRNGLIEL